MMPLVSRTLPSLTDVKGLIAPICADPRVSAVAIFGSVARGDANARSDIDILVVHDGPMPDDLADLVPGNVTMAFYTQKRLAKIPARSPLFALHLSRESIVVSDRRGEIAHTMHQVRSLSGIVASDLMASTNAKFDELLRQPRRLETAPTAAAAELYSLAKQTAMMLAAVDGRPCFNRRVALRGAYSSLSLAVSDQVQIDSLEEHWQMARHDTPDLPVPVDIEQASAAVRRLLTSFAL
jgi:hypothetical protein